MALSHPATNIEIPGYRIIRELGLGGMATVYLAVQESLEREIALKVMSPALAADETFSMRFMKEGRIAAKLNHLNILTVYDINAHGHFYYMATEYLPAGSARERIDSGMDEDEVIDTIIDVAQGLGYAHSHKIVHRDVKPGNILYRDDGSAVLADFGIAKAVDSKTVATLAGTSIGTPHYMSPEQARGAKVDGRSDLYSLGVVFFEMLTGRPPFDADDPFAVALMHVNETPPALPKEHARFQPVLSQLLAKNPDERFADSEALFAGMEKIMAESGEHRVIKPKYQTQRITNVEPSAEMVIPDRKGSVPLWVWLGSALTVLLAAGVLWYMFLGPGAESDRKRLVPVNVDSSGAGGQTDGGNQTGTPSGTDSNSGSGTSNNGSLSDTGGTASDNAASNPATPASPVNRLLEQADEFVAAGQLVRPSDRNALALFRQVLYYEPENERALAGINSIANSFETRAEDAWRSGELDQAWIILGEGLDSFPGRSGLTYLKSQLEGEYERQERNIPDAASAAAASVEPSAPAGDVNTLLARADELYRARKFTFPPGQNANEMFQQVLQIDPDNAEALAGLKRIADSYALAARASRDRGALKQALLVVETGLQVAPEHPELNQLKAEVEEAIRNEG